MLLEARLANRQTGTDRRWSNWGRPYWAWADWAWAWADWAWANRGGRCRWALLLDCLLRKLLLLLGARRPRARLHLHLLLLLLAHLLRWLRLAGAEGGHWNGLNWQLDRSGCLPLLLVKALEWRLLSRHRLRGALLLRHWHRRWTWNWNWGRLVLSDELWLLLGKALERPLLGRHRLRGALLLGQWRWRC